MTFKKPLVIATLAAAVTLGAVSQKAEAADPFLGALIGGGIGAAIGHDVNRHHGAAVGGVIGAMIGSSVAASSNDYYGDRYYSPAPTYGYAPSYGYAPAPVYSYGPPVYVRPAYGTVIYRSSPRHGYHRGAHYGHRRW